MRLHTRDDERSFILYIITCTLFKTFVQHDEINTFWWVWLTMKGFWRSRVAFYCLTELLINLLNKQLSRATSDPRELWTQPPITNVKWQHAIKMNRSSQQSELKLIEYYYDFLIQQLSSHKHEELVCWFNRVQSGGAQNCLHKMTI